MQGYEVQASDYIIKPLSYFDFAMKITRILKTIEGKTSTVLAITTTDGLRSINLADVSFLGKHEITMSSSLLCMEQSIKSAIV